MQSFCVAVLHDDADKPSVVGDLSDLVNAEMLFEQFGIPSDCQYASVGCETVDQCAEEHCKEEDGYEDEDHHKYPEHRFFRDVDKQLQSDSKECQTSQEAEHIFLRLISKHQLVHQGLFCLTAKGKKIMTGSQP